MYAWNNINLALKAFASDAAKILAVLEEEEKSIGTSSVSITVVLLKLQI